ncbi:MAG: GAF domain-containing protein [Anaerolineae bacterium]|nr:GAF domain-containing protein [Anaerolineae bacterium]
MGNHRTPDASLFKAPLWIGFALGAVYWLLESVVDVVFFDRGTFLQAVFSQDLHEIWMRSLVWVVLIAFGIYAQAVIDERKAFERKQQRVEDDYRQRTTQLEALTEVNLNITAQLDLDVLLHSIAAQAVDLLGGNSGGLYLYRPAEDVIEWAVSIGDDPVALGNKLRRGEGLAGKVWQLGAPISVDDYQHWEGRSLQYEGMPIAAVASVPVRWGDDFLGVLNVNYAKPAGAANFHVDTDVLAMFATQAAIAIRNARLYEETRRRVEQLAIVNRITRVIGTTLDIDDLLKIVYQELAPIFQHDAFFIALYDQETNEMDFRIQVDEGVHTPPQKRALGVGFTSRVVAERKPLLIRNFELERDTLPSLELWGSMRPALSWLGAPMLSSDRIIGVICVQAYHPYAYGEEETMLLSIVAEQVAVAIDSVWLFEASSQEIVARMQVEEALQESEARLDQQARLAAIGQLAGGIAHDFNNILTTITLYAQMLLTKPDFPLDLVPNVQTILDEARGASHLIQQTLDFSRRSIIDTRPVDLVALVEEIIDILRRTLPENIRLLMEIGPDEYVVAADATRIQQVVMNLALNARDAMPGGGELRIGLLKKTVTQTGPLLAVDMSPGEWVCLSISDTGTGIAEEVLEHLFEPFFTTKAPGKGTGLGLAQVYGIIKSHGGCIDVDTAVGHGTTFRIYLPAHAEAKPHAAEPADQSTPEGNGETILVVEDKDRVRDLISSILTSLNYRVLTAENGRQAVRVYTSTGDVALVVTDAIMPEMGGKDLVHELRQLTPTLKALIITGYSAAIDIQALREEGIVDVILKPFDIQTLASAVRRALDAP